MKIELDEKDIKVILYLLWKSVEYQEKLIEERPNSSGNEITEEIMEKREDLHHRIAAQRGKQN